MRGSVANDPFEYDGDEVVAITNRAGGINGGISNGMELTLSVALRPTPSISKPQKTVDLINKVNTVIEIKGRHDACVAVRAVPCIEAAVALALLDEII
jgi:chorismate synthase